MEILTENYILMGGAAKFHDQLYFSARTKEPRENGVTPHSYFGAYYQGLCYPLGDAPWDTQAVCVAKLPIEKMIAISQNGDVFTYAAGVRTEEQILPAPAGLINLGVIGGHAYACGLDRQVWKRVAEGQWESLHAPFSGEKNKNAFEAIGGFAEDDIYAAGWHGDMWHYDGKVWRQIDMPHSINLWSLICADDGYVYTSGNHGMMLRGRGDDWKGPNTEVPDEDMWDIHWFGKRLYVIGMSKIYTLGDRGGLVRVNTGVDAPRTCYRLTSADGVMWSVGPQDIFSFNGTAWARVELPLTDKR
jgi:hypothetical protein